MRALPFLALLSLTACAEPEPAPEPGDLLTDTAPASGADCPDGGTAIHAGLDDDGDGVLDGAEIDQTELVCADPPPPPAELLLRQDPLEPGAECPDGGTAVHSGLDDDGDGVLDDAEIDDTALVCGDASEPYAILYGDVEISDLTDPETLEVVSQVRVVTGNLLVTAPGRVHFPQLELVAGALEVSGVDTAEVAAPYLYRVGHLGLYQASSLTTLDLGYLREAGSVLVYQTGLETFDLGVYETGRLEVVANPALRSIDLGTFYHVGTMRIDSPALTSLTAPVLMDAYRVQLECDALTTLDLGDLQIIEEELYLRVGQVPSLATLSAVRSVPSIVVYGSDQLVDLQGLDSIADVRRLWIANNERLQSLDVLDWDHELQMTSLPDGLTIRDNPALTDLGVLGKLLRVDNLRIQNNAALTDLAGLDRLRSVENSLTIQDNDALGSLAALAELRVVGGTFAVSGDAIPQAEIDELRARVVP